MNKTLHKIYITTFFTIGLSSLILLIYNGYSYYSTALEERFFHPQHNLLKPSGVIGHGLGILGSMMIVIGVSIYVLRKRVKIFSRIGYLKHWLELHIFLCSFGPLLVLFHTAFKFGGIVSVSFWSMVIVVCSGIIGRFIYIQIPRTIQGTEIDVLELLNKKEKLINQLHSVLNPSKFNLHAILSLAEKNKNETVTLKNFLFFITKDSIKNYFYIKNIIRILKQGNVEKQKRKEIKKILKAQLILSRRISLLKVAQKLFHYWHIAHLPFAIIMFFIMIVHIIITILFGYKWIF